MEILSLLDALPSPASYSKVGHKNSLLKARVNDILGHLNYFSALQDLGLTEKLGLSSQYSYDTLMSA